MSHKFQLPLVKCRMDFFAPEKNIISGLTCGIGTKSIGLEGVYVKSFTPGPPDSQRDPQRTRQRVFKRIHLLDHQDMVGQQIGARLGQP